MLPDSRLRHLLSSKLMLLVVATILLTPAAALSADFGLVPTAPPNNNVEGSTVTFQVLVTGGSDSTPTITVDFEINGGPTIEDDDFLPGTNVSLAAGLTGTLTITGGVIDGQTYDLPIVLDDDVRVEANEFFGIAITGVSVGTSSGTPAVATIVNNDTATVQISTADQTVTEGDTGVTYTVELVGDIDPALTGDVTVTYGFDEAGTDTAEGVDYTDTIGGPVVLNQASRTHNIVLDIDDDGIVEPSEDFTLDLTGASASFGVGLGTDVQAITTITDDGDTATVEISTADQTVTEGDTGVIYTVELVGDIDAD